MAGQNAYITQRGNFTPGRMVSQAEHAIARAVDEVSLQVQMFIRAKMREPKTGRIYRRPGGRLHQASAPGEMPAVDSGALYKDIQRWPGFKRMSMRIGMTKPYALWLDEGTRNGHILPRPMIQPTYEHFAPIFVQTLRRNLGIV